EFIEADCGHVFLLTNKGAILSTVREWTAEGVQPQFDESHQMPFENYPWIRPQLLAFQPVAIRDVAAMPPEAHAEQLACARIGIRAFLLVPMVGRGALVGFLGFNMVGGPRGWEPADTELLQVVGEMVANAFLRCDEMNELQKSEERLRLTLESTTDGMWDYDFVNKSIFLSDSAARILGVESNKSSLSTNSLGNRIHPEDRGIVQTCFRDHLMGRSQRFEAEVRISIAENEWRHLFCRGMIVSWHDDQPTRMLGTVMDVSELRQSERSRLETEEKYRHLFEMETDAIFVIDDRDYILEANAATEDLYGYSRQYLLGMKFSGLVHTLSSEHESTAPSATGSALFFQTHIHCEGSFIPVEISMRRIPWQGKDVRIAAVRDISERLQAQQAIEAQRQFLKAVIDAEPSMIAVYDRDHRVMLVNNAVCDFLDKADNELLGRTGQELFPSIYTVESFRREDRELYAGRLERTDCEYKIQNFRGDTRWVRLIRLPLRDKDGHITAILSVGINLTEEKQLKAELLRTGQLASLGELAAGLAHEINNPVNGIINYAQMLMDMIEDGGMVDETGSRFLGKIITEGERIARLAHGVLGFARTQLKEEQPCSVGEAARSVLELVESRLLRDGIQLSVDMSPDLPPVNCVAWELQQVLMNLVSNAHYALNERFPGHDPNKRLAITAAAGHAAQGPTVVVTVEDNGAGIEDALLDDVLDPFFTTKPPGQGTGLGLSICHSIIREHHGSLEFEKPEQGGARVVVTLPAIPDDRNKA
ncbi:MAG: PAS domain S-box protein, partial [Oceanidesulfovibrio sp.]